LRPLCIELELLFARINDQLRIFVGHLHTPEAKKTT